MYVKRLFVLQYSCFPTRQFSCALPPDRQVHTGSISVYLVVINLDFRFYASEIDLVVKGQLFCDTI